MPSKLNGTNDGDMKIRESKFAKKSLGQNFLKSEKALREMAESGEISDNETVLEIGPGMGALTEKILDIVRTKKNTRLIAIEKDDRLIQILNEKFAQDITAGIFKLIHADALEILKNSSSKVAINFDKVIANIPYYITGLIFRSIFSQKNLPKKVVMLVQKEVAKRIVAKDEKGRMKENLLSLSIKLYGVPKIISIVPRGAFVPAPNVDSAIISVDILNSAKNGAVHNTPKTIKNDREIEQQDEEKFFDMLHHAFAHKRKKLIQNLKNIKGIDVIRLEQIFIEQNLDSNVRAEDLSLEQYISIFKTLNTFK